jgi:hypothetical protein
VGKKPTLAHAKGNASQRRMLWTTNDIGTARLGAERTDYKSVLEPQRRRLNMKPSGKCLSRRRHAADVDEDAYPDQRTQNIRTGLDEQPYRNVRDLAFGGCSGITRASPIDPRASWRVMIDISDPILLDTRKLPWPSSDIDVPN